MKNNNYSDETISRYLKILNNFITHGINLDQPNDVLAHISTQKWTNGTKQRATNAIRLYYKTNNIQTELPKYKTEERIPFIPQEQELDQLISGTKHQLATFLQTLKETAARYGEALRLKWTDLDTENTTLTFNQPEKGSRPRTAKISNKLLIMLSALPHATPNIFQYKTKDSARKTFMRARKRIATNLGNPRILQIHFHTFRHWKATTLFHKTSNVLIVMKLLGHKNLNNTQRYIQLLPDLNDDYVSAEAHNIQEARKLIDDGYEYVQTIGDTHLYRKRK